MAKRKDNRDERRAQHLMDARIKEYREFRTWATHLLADAVIRHGFSELGVCVDRIVQSLRTMDNKHNAAWEKADL